MWVVYAFGSSVFAGITSILAKYGIRKTNSNVATAVRTIVVLAFAWLMVFVTGAQEHIGDISAFTYLFLILSGFATGASWLCYFRALQLGDVNKVVPIDKSSTVISMLLAIIFFNETDHLAVKLAGIVIITVGTYLMIEKKKGSEDNSKDGGKWLIYALLSAVFAALTSILGKIGIADIDSNLGTAIRTSVVLVMAWTVVFATGKQHEAAHIPKKELLFICLSGIATGASWLCYFRALQDGIVSIVIPIDRLSILITVAFSYIAFKEKLTKKSFAGLVLITAGTLLMVTLG